MDVKQIETEALALPESLRAGLVFGCFKHFPHPILKCRTMKSCKEIRTWTLALLNRFRTRNLFAVSRRLSESGAI